MATYHFIKHFNLINKHRFLVFVHSIKLGIPIRGLLHDLSKYSPTEFINSAKYYNGNSSPIYAQRLDNKMYSTISVHHIKHNKHHFEYWIDFFKGNLVLRAMPYKYALEYVADMISASKVYNHKNYTKDKPLAYFLERKDHFLMNSCTKEFVEKLLTIYKDQGFKPLKKKLTKKIYDESLTHYKDVEFIEIKSFELK